MIVAVNKQERECAIVDIAVAGDKRIVENIRSLKGHYKDVEHENCAGDTDCCRIIRKCDEELGEVAGKLDTRISISLPPKNHSSRNRKDFQKSVSQF